MTNFEKYIQDSQPSGLSKRDIYNSIEMQGFLEAIGHSVDNNIKSGMFEEDMLTELKDIKSLLKTDLKEAVSRSNAYAPTVKAVVSGVEGSSQIPTVPQTSLDWLTEKRITNPEVLSHNLSLIKSLWGSSASEDILPVKPLTTSSSPSFSATTETTRFPTQGSNRFSDLGGQVKSSVSSALSPLAWMGAPASPYLDIAKSLWDISKPLRNIASDVGGSVVDGVKQLGKTSISDIDKTWKSGTKSNDISASPDKLKPATIDFPTDISINNFGEFESWLEVWLGSMLSQGHITEESILTAVQDLITKSDSHLALLMLIAEKFDLPTLSQKVYEAGVNNVSASPQFGSLTSSMLQVSSSLSPRVTATPLWDAVSSFSPRPIEYTPYEEIDEDASVLAVRAEKDRDARADLMEGTKSYFKGIESAINDLQDESKSESDQTQDILSDIKEVSGKGESSLGSFLTSVLGGFSSLASGFSSLFNPTMIAGLGAMVAYFSSEGFRSFVNGVAGFAWDKTKDFFDPKTRSGAKDDIVGASASTALASTALSKGLGSASSAFGRSADVAGRASNIAKIGGSGSTSLQALQASNKVAQGLSKVASSGFTKVAGKAGVVGAVAEGLNTGLGFLGYDVEVDEMNAASSGKYSDVFGGQDLSGLKISPELAKQAGLDNLTWKDYLSSAAGGASLGAVAGGGWASVITSAVGAGLAVWAMTAEAKDDYKKFAKEQPEVFMQMLAAKRGGLSLDRISFKNATGSGTQGFVKWMQDNKGEIKDAMSYSGNSKTGVYNMLHALWNQAEANPHTPIKDLQTADISKAIMPLISASPIKDRDGVVTDLNVQVNALRSPNRGAFITQVDDALTADWFSKDSTELHRVTSALNELDSSVGDDFDYASGSPDVQGHGVINKRSGLRTANDNVKLSGFSSSNIVNFANNLPTDVTGAVTITSGVRTIPEQKAVMQRLGRLLSDPDASRSPHVSGRALDLAYSSGLASFFASERGYKYITDNNIDPAFLWAETDVKGRHFHVQPKKNNDSNKAFYDPVGGYQRYKAYTDLRIRRANNNETSKKYEADLAYAMSDKPAYVTKKKYSSQFERDRATAMSFFISKGLTKEQAAGVLGNLIHESGGLNTRAVAKNDAATTKAQKADTTGKYDSVGLAQWNKDRLSNLRGFAKARSKDVYDFQTQLDFIWHEMQGSHKHALSALQKTTSVKDATKAFGQKYEVPHEATAAWNTRTSHGANALAVYQGSPASDSYDYNPSSAGIKGIPSSGSGWQYAQGEWYSGLTNSIKVLGELFSGSEGDDTSFLSPQSTTPVMATPLSKDNAAPTSSPRRLQTAPLDISLFGQPSSGSTGGDGSGGSVVNAPTTHNQTIYNNTVVNSKRNLYTQQG